MGKLVKIPDETKEAIRNEYLMHVGLNDLAAKYKVSTATISAWRRDENWADIRKAADEGLLDDLVQGRKIRLSKLTEIGIDQIERGLIHLKNRVEPLSVGELEKLTIVVSNLHKVTRLDQEKSTENVAMKVNVDATLSVERIRELVMSDPFFTVPKDVDEKA